MVSIVLRCGTLHYFNEKYFSTFIVISCVKLIYYSVHNKRRKKQTNEKGAIYNGRSTWIEGLLLMLILT